MFSKLLKKKPLSRSNASELLKKKLVFSYRHVIAAFKSSTSINLVPIMAQISCWWSNNNKRKKRKKERKEKEKEKKKRRRKRERIQEQNQLTYLPGRGSIAPIYLK